MYNTLPPHTMKHSLQETLYLEQMFCISGQGASDVRKGDFSHDAIRQYLFASSLSDKGQFGYVDSILVYNALQGGDQDLVAKMRLGFC